jgi:hypothetical protein
MNGTILVVLLLVVAMTTSSASQSLSTTSISLPSFTFHMLVNNKNLNLYDFRNHMDHVTNNHLMDFLGIAMGYTPHGAAILQAAHLESSLRTNPDRNGTDTDPRSQINVTFIGSMTIFTEGGSAVPDMHDVHLFLSQALMGDSYWKLMQRFVEDSILDDVDNLEISLDESTASASSGGSGGGDGGQGTVVVLAIFSILLFAATAVIVYLGYHRYHSSSESCCHQSKVSESTDEEEEGPDEFEDEQHPKKSNTTPPRKKKRRVKRTGRMVMEVLSLDSIQEESNDEDGMATIPRGMAPETILI